MKLIYVAGKYRDTTSAKKLNNINHHIQVCYRLITEGWSVISPVMNTVHFDDLPQELIMPHDLEILSRCDAIYMLSNWDSSEGAQAELRQAKRDGLEIYFEEEE